MIIRITAAGETILRDPDDFRRFSIRFDPNARASEVAQAALARIARPDEGAAWVSVAALRHLAPRSGDPEWEAGLARMIAFAQSRGWVDGHGGIRAHIEAAE